jgi:hypothetical protein
MRLNDSSRVQLTATVTATTDPTAGTLFLIVDAVPHSCTWDGPATSSSGRWFRTAHTDDHFAGPAVPADQVDGATVLSYGQHPAELRLTIADTIVASVCEPVTVRVD